jgi:mycothiol synthase
MVAPDMNDVTVTRRLGDADRANLHALLRRIADDDGFWPLSDQLMADLEHPRSDDAGRPISVVGGAAGSDPWGYAQASTREGGWTMQVATHRAANDAGRVRLLADAVVNAVDAIGDGEIDWWVYQPGPEADAVAAASGFAIDRDLLQMRRDLPAERRSAVETRAFVPGQDESAWLAVNNRAFAGHAEQSGWTLDTVRQRMEQPWFDPGGLRLHERDGRLAAFCWTKIHDSPVPVGGEPPGEPTPCDSAFVSTAEPAEQAKRDLDAASGRTVPLKPIGEIYVIGVDPDFQGLGLGRELTLAGLDHMVDAGIHDAMLYVDGGNEAATTLYRRLGFQVRRTDRAFRRASRVVR